MIATGTDIRPLEVLVFFSDICKSRSYYEQMKVVARTNVHVTNAAKLTKDHFCIIDAIGVEEARRLDSL